MALAASDDELMRAIMEVVGCEEYNTFVAWQLL
jgi:hypothetical protein